MPTPTYTALANITLGSSASSVTFSSIPQGFRDLVLVGTGQRTDGTGALRLRLNSDSGNNYSEVSMFGNGSTVLSYGGTYDGMFQIGFGSPSAIGSGITQFMDYSATDKHKTILMRASFASSTQATANRWANTSAIITITIADTAGNMSTGSTFTLYGIEA